MYDLRRTAGSISLPTTYHLGRRSVPGMRRATTLTATLLTVTALTTGCGYFHKGRLSESLEYHLEVTGVTTDKIDYSVINEDNSTNNLSEPTPALPWKIAGITWPGKISVTLVPTGGPATCRIVVEKKEVAKKVGQPGVPLTCDGTVKGS
jgi:hypothetical protein